MKKHGNCGENNGHWKGGVTSAKYHCKKCAKHAHLGKNASMYGKSPSYKTSFGKRTKYNKIWFRSSYEYLFAKWLNKNKIKWHYESKTFDLGNTTYTPDFYLPDTDTYIEIKGYWLPKAKKKFKLFKHKFPNIIIQIIEKIKLQALKILKGN